MCAKKLPFLVKNRKDTFRIVFEKEVSHPFVILQKNLRCRKCPRSVPPRGDTLCIPILIHSVSPVKTPVSFLYYLDSTLESWDILKITKFLHHLKKFENQEKAAIKLSKSKRVSLVEQIEDCRVLRAFYFCFKKVTNLNRKFFKRIKIVGHCVSM